MPSVTAARERHAVTLLYTFLREASALSVRLRWAVPEPRSVGRTTVRLSRFLFLTAFGELERNHTINNLTIKPYEVKNSNYDVHVTVVTPHGGT